MCVCVYTLIYKYMHMCDHQNSICVVSLTLPIIFIIFCFIYLFYQLPGNLDEEMEWEGTVYAKPSKLIYQVISKTFLRRFVLIPWTENVISRTKTTISLV